MKVYLVDPKLLTLSRIFTIDVSAWGISYVEDEYIAVDKGNISWIDPATGRQIRELKTGFYDTRFASSICLPVAGSIHDILPLSTAMYSSST
jgi:hypothetical protein